MKICALNPFFYPYHGGTEKVLFELYGRLAKRHDVCVISAGLPPNNKVERSEEINGIEVIRLRSDYINLPFLPIPMPVMRGVGDKIKSVNADIYHINNRYLYYWGALNSIKTTRGRLTITLHNALPKGINPLIDTGGLLFDLLWGRKIMRDSKAVIGITKSVIETTVPKDLMWKTSIIFNGIDTNRFTRRGGRKVDKIREFIGGDEIILNVARLTWQKGQVYLLRAFSKIAKERKGAVLLIIGSGHMKKWLLKEARRLGIMNKFRILSNVEEEALPYYYNAADVFALPSLYEPASIAILEALASKTPVVASNIGGIPEMMKDAGRYSTPRDSESIASGIIDALEDKAESRRLAETGRRLMLKEHDWDTIANKYEALFRNCISSR
ncbi:MAG: glycosyltransferase family 4 protein [Candidatus Micrarchaeaceae archaeon]